MGTHGRARTHDPGSTLEGTSCQKPFSVAKDHNYKSMVITETRRTSGCRKDTLAKKGKENTSRNELQVSCSHTHTHPHRVEQQILVNAIY